MTDYSLQIKRSQRKLIGEKKVYDGWDFSLLDSMCLILFGFDLFSCLSLHRTVAR